MKYYIITYGCQMNKSDSEKIASRLKDLGHKPAKNAEEANIVAVNFCSVRQSAVHRALAQLHNYKSKQLIAAGCLLPKDQKKLTAQNITIWHPDDYFTDPPLRPGKFSAFVPIMTGCNNFCSYCAVPFTRGREKSRPAQEIITEIKKLLKKGVKEIILLGQNVNSYNSPQTRLSTPPFVKGGGEGFKSPLIPLYKGRNKSINFPSLLRLINSLPGDFRLSFISSHPKDMTDELIETCAKCEKILPYIHLPVQSGDNKILCAMNRHYTVAHYNNLVKKLRSAFARQRRALADKSSFSPLAVSTDIIVGFPGETVKQFQNTLKLIKDVKFDMIYFARYSPRSGTAAARLKDNVSPQEKKRRAQLINAQLKKDALALNKKYINQEVEVLIEKIEGKFAFGKTITNKEVKIYIERHPEPRKCRPELACPATAVVSGSQRGKLVSGSIITAKITDAGAWSLKGEL